MPVGHSKLKNLMSGTIIMQTWGLLNYLDKPVLRTTSKNRQPCVLPVLQIRDDFIGSGLLADSVADTDPGSDPGAFLPQGSGMIFF
jgi:hypothetical protein